MSNLFFLSQTQFARPSGNGGTRSDEQGRSCFRKDYGRLLHAPSFRRLQGKTQLFPGAESDFFRNRLTHSLEVAQIARGIAGKINEHDIPQLKIDGAIDEDLVEFAAIAHDLGHPPFGHNGEYALDGLMRKHGGFEGNAQTLRILAQVERKIVSLEAGKFSHEYGLDLTYRSLASVLKYDNPIKKVRKKTDSLCKGYYESESELVQEIKNRVSPNRKGNGAFKTIECAIMDIADDIAYSTYDLEDSLHAGFVSPLGMANALVNDTVILGDVLRKTNKALAESGHKIIAKNNAVKELVDVIVRVFGIYPPAAVESDARAFSTKNGQSSEVYINVAADAWLRDRTLTENGLVRTKLTAVRVGRLISAVDLVANRKNLELSSVKMRRDELLEVEVLKHLNYELVIRSPRLAVVEHRGKDLIEKIFTALLDSDGALLPPDWCERFKEEKARKIPNARRVICDYVACMTDRYAAELYQRLFDEGPTIFKPL